MNIAIVQYDIMWESPSENLKKIESYLKENPQDFDLLVLPEMFTTGFSMNTRQNAEKPEGETLDWMRKLAKEHDGIVTGSIIIEEGGNFYNRLFWVKPDASFDHYDKRHLFTLAREDKYFCAGSERKIFELSADGEEWKICPLICYDLRFPVWSRNTEDFDLLIYVANFPEKREFAWSQLLIARAIENQCFVMGVNRVGRDGKEIPYSGKSAVLGYDGRSIMSAGCEEGVFYVNVTKEKLNAFRRAYGFLRDRDEFTLV